MISQIQEFLRNSIVVCVVTLILTAVFTGQVFAQSQTLLGADFSGSVYQIDLATGAETEIIDLPFNGDIPNTINALAYDANNRRVVASTGGSLFGQPIIFFEFDPFAKIPQAEIIVEYTPVSGANRVTGIAFDSAGNFFVAESNSIDNRLIQYDLETFSVLNDYDLPNPANFNIGDLSVGRNPGEITAAHASQELVLSIGVPNGPVDEIGQFDQQGFTNGFALDLLNDRYYISDTRLIEIDPQTGETLRIISDQSYMGLTFVTAIPEPNVGIIIIGAVIGLTGRRRKDH